MRPLGFILGAFNGSGRGLRTKWKVWLRLLWRTYAITASAIIPQAPRDLATPFRLIAFHQGNIGPCVRMKCPQLVWHFAEAALPIIPDQQGATLRADSYHWQVLRRGGSSEEREHDSTPWHREVTARSMAMSLIRQLRRLVVGLSLFGRARSPLPACPRCCLYYQTIDIRRLEGNQWLGMYRKNSNLRSDSSRNVGRNKFTHFLAIKWMLEFLRPNILFAAVSIGHAVSSVFPFHGEISTDQRIPGPVQESCWQSMMSGNG